MKNLVVVSDGFLWKAKWEGGGELPAELNNHRWTHQHLAEKAVAEYLSTKGTSKNASKSRA